MAASYLYNAQGERVKKTVNGSSTLFHYDQARQLIAETDDQGALIQEYIYLDGTRLATVTAALPQEVITFVHTDHLGSPLALSDLLGAVQWKGSYDPYGTVTVEIDNVSQKLRFPGQYADAETGMHYNYFRDYDPEIGRYLQSDPIGLKGGMNTFGYVGGNPVNAIDPLGLEGRSFRSAVCRVSIETVCTVGGAIGGAIGGCVLEGAAGGAGGTLVVPGYGTVGGAAGGCTIGAASGGMVGGALGNYFGSETADKYCDDDDGYCKELAADIERLMKLLKKRYFQALIDKLNLYNDVPTGSRSWASHAAEYKATQKALRRKIGKARNPSRPCTYNLEADKWMTMPFPELPADRNL